jgi:DNA-binding SARP family transcriptional activator
MIELFLFGGIELRRDGDANDPELHRFLAQPRAVALLIYLAIAGRGPGAFHRRDTLVAMFWPETDQEHARTNLRKLVHVIRKHSGDDVVESRGDEELRVNPAEFWCDVWEFESAIVRGRLARADELYRGPLCPGFNLSSGTPAPEFDQWLSNRRMELAEKAADAAWKLATMLEGEANLTDASRWAKRAARLSLTDERRFRRAIQMLMRAGNRATALVLCDELRKRLAELGPDVRPSPETEALCKEIRGR